MKRHRLVPFAASVLLAVLLAAASVGVRAAGWSSVVAGTPLQNAKGGYAIDMPDGWHAISVKTDSMATRDGAGLQRIEVSYVAHKKAFPATKKLATGQTLPQDLAQMFIAELKTRGFENFSVLSEGPQQLGGRPAFRLHVEYRSKTESGSVRTQEIVCGTSDERGIHYVSYRAPVLYYFARDIEKFETALASFRYVAPPPTKSKRT